MTKEKFFKEDISLKRKQFQLKETVSIIIAEEDSHIEAAKKEIQKRRNEIEKFIRRNKLFEVTLEPFKCSKKDPEIIRRMYESSKKLNVGPMATVAGVIAEYAVKAMISEGAKYAIVDNGGDIALFTNRVVNIGVYTGNHLTRQFAFEIHPTDRILGICTSSGMIGHSFSFGNTDAVIVISHDVSVADAAATALGNLVNTEKDIKDAFKILENIEEITGAIIIINNKIGLWGEVPEIVQAKVPYELIAKGW